MGTTTSVLKSQGQAESEETAALQKQSERPVARQMEILLPKIEDLLPLDIPFEQFRAALYLELSGRPKLAECVPESLRDSVLYAANYGLLPGRDCHFLPFKQKRYGGRLGSTCVANYFGVILTMERSGKIRRAFAHPVHEGDEWVFDMFADRPTHRPAITLGKKPGKELFYYGAVMFKDGTCAFEVMTLDELEGIRKAAPSHDNGPWQDNPVMMKRKSAIKRVAKYVKLTPSLRALLTEDDAREQEDIPPARHHQNLVDLYGEGAGGYVHQREPHQETREVVKVQRTAATSTPTTPESPNRSTGHPDAKNAYVPQGDAWDTLRQYQGDARLEDAMLERIEAALAPLAPATDSEALALAREVLEALARTEA